MAIDKNLLAALKKHKFKNKDVITYTELNDEFDTKTPTDVANQIYKTFKGSNTKDQKLFLDAIFDDVYAVIENTSKNSKTKFALMNPKNNTFADLYIKNNNKGGILFEANNTNIKIQIVINTPEVVEKNTPSDVLKLENEILEKKYGISINKPNLKSADYKAISKIFQNMANVK